MGERELRESPPLHHLVLELYRFAADRHRRDPSAATGHALGEATELLETALLLLPGRFELGHIVATPGAIETLQRAGHHPAEFLLRHHHGEWGDLDPEDRAANERAVRDGSRLVSAYSTRTHEKLWIISEHDRSVTTILRPDEY